MFEKIIELFFVKKSNYKKNTKTVLRQEKEYHNNRLNVKEELNDINKSSISSYFMFRNGLNVRERELYCNNINTRSLR